MTIVVKNGHADPSSTLAEAVIISHGTNSLRKSTDPSLFMAK